jgi:hypothetical protein
MIFFNYILKTYFTLCHIHVNLEIAELSYEHLGTGGFLAI